MGDRGSGAAALLAASPRNLPSFDVDQIRPRPALTSCTGWQRRSEMLDAIMLAAGVAFFVLAVAYSAACDRM